MSKFNVSAVTLDVDIQTCFKLRHTVFVEEQGVPVDLEIDEFDQDDSIHFLGRFEGEPIAAARIRILGDTAKIQRVVVLKEFRGRALGRELMLKIMAHVRDGQLANKFALDAQTYALAFYQELGFQTLGGEFDDAGIPHIHMIKAV